VVTLAVIVFAECALMAAASVYLVVELLVDVPLSYGSAIAILLLALLSTVWLAVLGINTLRGRFWVRGAIVVWQVLQLAVGVGALQGAFARPDIGWALIIPAVLAFALLFTPSVVAATARRDDE
jgi:hypothetical protein